VPVTHTWPWVLSALMAGEDLPGEAAAWAMGEIMSGEATAAQVAGFAVALRAKGETVEELEGLVATMYDHAVTFEGPPRAVDVVGTGGDRAHTVNISTMAALVVAGAGVPVVKHGNRAASSSCGAADLLEALGVRLDLPVADVAAIAAEVGITFCFAPMFHPALRHAAAPRRELGVPTTFNLLGPLANPARTSAAAVGVADRRMAPLVAGVLARRGTSALVFRGDDGLDELTTATTSSVWDTRSGAVVETSLDPSSLALAPAPAGSLRGGDASHNADVARRLLAGERGAVRDAVLLNAAAAVTAFESDPTVDLAQGVAAALDRVADSVDSGAAAGLLERWVRATRRR
jgi:anthranilate phosphoribosyltransferase